MMAKIFDNTYYEALAAYVLVKTGVIPYQFTCDWIKDRPDIQINNEFGIEVVQAMTKKDGHQRYYSSKLLSCNNYNDAVSLNSTKEFSKSELSIEKLGDTNNPVVFSPVTVGLPTQWSEIVAMKVQEKINKFHDYPNSEAFVKKGVFVHTNDPMLLYFGDTKNTFYVIQSLICSSIVDVVYLLFPSSRMIQGIPNFIAVENTEITQYIFGSKDPQESTLQIIESLYGTDSTEYKYVQSSFIDLLHNNGSDT